MDNATEKLVATKEESGDVDHSESESVSFQEEAKTERPIAYKIATGKPNASSESDHPLSPKAERIKWSHKPHVAPATIHHTEAVFSIVRRIYGREHDDPMDDLDVNMAIWGIFLKLLFKQQFILDKTTIRQETNSNNFGVFGINYQIRIRLSLHRGWARRWCYLQRHLWQRLHGSILTTCRGNPLFRQ